MKTQSEPELTLSLLVTRIRTNDINPAFSADNFAVFANFFNAGTDFHL